MTKKIPASRRITHFLQELEGESRREVAGEDERVEEESLGRRPLLRVLGQGDLNETARAEEEQTLDYALLNRAGVEAEEEEASKQAELISSLNQYTNEVLRHLNYFLPF